MTELLEATIPQYIHDLHAYHVPLAPAQIRLDANESPWCLPTEAQKRLGDLLGKLPYHRYPDAHAQALRSSIANWVGCTEEELTFGTGSDEIIGSILTAFSKPKAGNKKPCVLFPTPTFSMYEIIGQARGFKTVGVPTDTQWDLDVDRMVEAIEKEQPNVVFIASPNNPTGNCVSAEKLKSLIENFPETFFVLDEAYIAFAEKSLSELYKKYAHVGILGTLSKIGLAGIRLGWLQAQKPIIDVLEKVRLPFNVTLPSQAIAHFALTELAPVLKNQIKMIVEERNRLGDSLRQFSQFNVFPSQANFWFLKVQDSKQLASFLEEKHIRIRAFQNGPLLENCVRITVGTPKENDALISTLKLFYG